MLNLDGGHYFLTVLAPVRIDTWQDADGTITSFTSSLRKVLATLPTAEQSVASIGTCHGSPFSRCQRTHLTRFVIIDQPHFNGRVPADSIGATIMKTNLLKGCHVDALPTAWLLWSVDFDPDPALAGAADQGLNDYLIQLWAVMRAELSAIFSHCYGFENVKDGQGFAAYITRCQIETTMPFNDYWATPPSLPSVSLNKIALGIGVITVGLTGLAVWRCGALGMLAIIPALALALYLAYRYILARGGKAFATAPNSNLKSVLKSLYLQQKFVRFAIDNQTAGAAALYAAFGAFLAQHQPENVDLPTQNPGVIRA